ncbi:MAG: hypothetical protein ACRD38_12595 [Nitrososphaerales archaeon]
MEYRSKGKGVDRKAYPLKPKKVMTSTEKSGTVNPNPEATHIITNEADKGVDSKEEEDTDNIDATD